MSQPATVPRFARPPISEVALSVLTEQGFMSEYDVKGLHDLFVEELPGILVAAPIEDLSPLPRTGPLGAVTIPLSIDPTSKRWWFVSPDQSRLVQAQPNFFGVNWRRTNDVMEAVSYPGFDNIFASFQESLGKVRRWHQQSGRECPAPLSCELLYDNMILAGTPPSQGIKLSDILRGVAATEPVPMYSWSNAWFEPVPEAQDPDQTSLAVDVRAGSILRQNGESVPIVKLQFSARARVSTWEGVASFFEAAHDRILTRLMALTTDAIVATWEPL